MDEFNLSLKSNWNGSYVFPVFLECNSEVAILHKLGILFESIVCDNITDKFKHVISVRQHGFMKDGSTATNLGAINII